MKKINLKNFINDAELPSRLCGVYVSLVFIVHPLLVHNGYFDITRTKSDCFAYLTLAFLAAMCLLLALRRELPRPEPRACAFCVFAGTLILSSLLFNGTGSVWLGENNRYQGILTNMLYAAAGITLCRCGRAGRGVRMAMLTGFAFVSALAVLNHLGCDPLGFIGRLRSSDRGRFISTLGNVNFFSAYTVLLLPVCASLALRESRAARRAVLWLLCTAGLWAAMAGRCESAVLGLIAAILLLPVLHGDDTAALQRFPLLLPGCAAAGELYSLAAERAGAELSVLTRSLLSPFHALAVSAVGAALWAVLRRKDDKAVLRARRIYCIALAALLVLGCIFMALANTVLRDGLDGVIGSYVVIDDDWGSDRGKIWKSFLEMFAAASPAQKLIGGGAGCVIEWDKTHRVFADAVTDAAHNEYLHYLLTNGLLGLGAYALFLGLTARSAVKSAAGRCLLTGCAAYAVQAAVNIAQPVSTPLFFLMLFLCGGDEPETERERSVKGGVIRASACAALALTVLVTGAVNGAPRPLSDPASHETQSSESMVLYTASKAALYLLPGGDVYTELPPRTALEVVGRTADWLQVNYEGMTLYVRAAALVPASELGRAG